MSDTTNPFGIDPVLYQRLGQVTIHWSKVEYILGELLAFLLRANPGRLYVVTQNIAGSTVTDWCRVLSEMEFADEPTRKFLAELFHEIDEARKDRNLYVHGLWSPGPEPHTAVVRTVRWERREVIKDQLVTQGDLVGLLEQTNDHFLALDRIGRQLGFRKGDNPQ